MSPIVRLTRTVYRAHGSCRSRFTKQAAYRDAAMLVWWKKYPCRCDYGDEFTSGEACEWHTDDGKEWRVKVAYRLARLWMRRDRKVAK